MLIKPRTSFLKIALLLALLLPALPAAAEKSIYMPTFSGTLRARYEYLTQQNKGAFKVRNLRLGIEGYVAPVMSYRAEADFSDWGKVLLVDAYVRLTPVKGLYFNLGQSRMPVTIAAHRAPCQQYFANRTFLARHLGIRDLGLVGNYTFAKVPLTLQASVFNCSGTGAEKNFWTNSYGFTAKIISPFLPHWYASASTARLKRGIAWSQVYDVGAYFDNGLWHVEGEYLHRHYNHDLFTAVNAFDFFVYRNFPIDKKMVSGVSGAVRYDYMSDFSSGTPGADGKLFADFPECHRLTAGATLSFTSKFQADIRLNYEKYFFRKGVVPGTADDDRLVLELIAHF
ncbi:MAG: porin [Muribaculaceae bacterium]|nr:porin [Muribaculaceae bacterium]